MEKEIEIIEESDSKSTIELLNDPQTFSEKLFGKLKSTNQRFEVRIMMMDVISRCIANHKLLLLNFYPYFQKYLEPHQQHITKILAIAAQASHNQVPPEIIEPLVSTIANHFVNDRSSTEAISAGINTIREICSRQPLVMSETLLSDLTQYSKAKNRYIFHAARGLITLFRTIDPKMLKRRDRGKDTDLSKIMPKFGQDETIDMIDGIELLRDFKEGKISLSESEEDEESEDEIDDDNKQNDDEEIENNSEDEKKINEEKKKQLQEFISKNILTEEDFELIKKLKEKQQLLGKKKKLTPSEVVNLEDIEVKIRKTFSQKRKDGEPLVDGKEKYKKKRKERTSKTNKDKIKNKPFMLSKYSNSVRKKNIMGAAQKLRKKEKSMKKSLKFSLKHF